MWEHSVLFIGNSFLFDIPWMYRELLASTGIFNIDRINVQQFTKSGWKIGQHWDLINEVPDSKLGHFLGDNQNDSYWDFVVIQEQSQLASMAASEVESDARDFLQSANDVMLLSKTIARRGAAVRLVATWGYRNGDTDHLSLSPDFDSMQRALNIGFAKYLQLLKDNEINAELIPVNKAWTRVYQAASVAGAGGEEERGSSRLFSKLYQERDGAHPSMYGAYLAACVAFSSLLRRSPVGIAWAPEGISESDRLLMQSFAEASTMHESMSNHPLAPSPSPMPPPPKSPFLPSGPSPCLRPPLSTCATLTDTMTTSNTLTLRDERFGIRTLSAMVSLVLVVCCSCAVLYSRLCGRGSTVWHTHAYPYHFSRVGSCVYSLVQCCCHCSRLLRYHSTIPSVEAVEVGVSTSPAVRFQSSNASRKRDDTAQDRRRDNARAESGDQCMVMADGDGDGDGGDLIHIL